MLLYKIQVQCKKRGIKVSHSNGNALFLILIAVALFAALSYAVTQSGRGSGSASKEQALIDAAVITQYANMISTTATRMILTGTTTENLKFCSGTNKSCVSSSASNLCDSGHSTPGDCMFSPEGGGMNLQQPPQSALGSGINLRWTFIEATSASEELNFEDIGTSAFDAYMKVSIISQAVCDAINDGLGLGAPTEVNEDVADDDEVNSYPGESFFCISNNGDNTYFHVLAAR